MLKMQLGNVAQAKTGGQFVAEKTLGMFERVHGLLLLALGSTHRDAHARVAPIRADVRLDHVHGQKPGVLGLESNNLGELLSYRFGNPQRPPFIHTKLSAISDQLSAQQPLPHGRGSV
jgi:hypothetical protein